MSSSLAPAGPGDHKRLLRLGALCALEAYLAHFWRFSFAARGHWFGPSIFSKPLCEAIQRAYQNCPDDPDIRAWHEAMQKDGDPPTYSPDFRFKPVALQCEYEAERPASDQ